MNHICPNILQAAGISERKIQGCPLEEMGFGGRGEYNAGHIQLWLKVGPIASLAHFHVVKMKVSNHVLLGRLWLHKHWLVLSTYHQCVKGRLNGKMIRIAATEKSELILLLKEFKDVFAWDCSEMLRLDPRLVVHSLNMDLEAKLVAQLARIFHTKIEGQIVKEV